MMNKNKKVEKKPFASFSNQKLKRQEKMSLELDFPAGMNDDIRDFRLYDQQLNLNLDISS